MNVSGWLDIIRGSQGQAVGRPMPVSVRAGEPDDTLWLRDAFHAAASPSGESVTVDRALTLDAVLACVRVLSDSVAALPLRVYLRTSGGALSEQWSRPVSRLLRDEPNPEMTAADLWGTVVAHLNLWGNAYLGKTLRGGVVVALWPIHPERVRVGRERGVKTFYVRSEDGVSERRHTAADVIHIRGLGLDGLTGLSPIEMARVSIGAGLAMDTYQSGFWRNDATPRGTLNVAGKLSESAADRLANRWRSLFGGPRNAGKVPVLEEGLTFTPISVSSQAAEFVDSRRMTGQQVCRIFRVPPEMVGMDSGNSLTYSTVEGQGIHFERYSIRPWITRVEQALNRDRDLFPTEGRGLFCEIDTQSLLRADLKTRYEAYAKGLTPASAFLTPNEVRRWERLPEDPMFDRPTEQPAGGAVVTPEEVQADA